MEKVSYRSIVLSECPPIDKVAAKVLTERALGVSLPIVQFWGHPVCPQEQLRKWESEDIFPIDLGEEKYHSAGCKSATEAVASFFYINLSWAESRLLDIIAKNNRSGYLKGLPYPIAWIMRELYKLPGYDHREVLDHAGKVISAWLDGKELSVKRTERPETDPVLERLIEKTDPHRQFAPFTVSRYIRDLWLAGQSPKFIAESAQYWIDGYDKAKRAIEEGKHNFASMNKVKFMAGELNGWAIETNDPFVVKAGSYASGVLIAKNGAGQAVIQTNRMNVTALARELKACEDGKWHHQDQQGIIMNGGFMYSHLEPTDLSLEQLVALVQQFPPQTRQNHRRVL